ncbi:hypothetical protein XFEB_01575 [Xylella fastidiosa EB92.1]|nr:hypothetical protein XFEB_01575 [Xylella fastidiosa EB92.1]
MTEYASTTHKKQPFIGSLIKYSDHNKDYIHLFIPLETFRSNSHRERGNTRLELHNENTSADTNWNKSLFQRYKAVH